MTPSGDIDTCVLALDIRPRSFGFVMLEGAKTLLDWGARSYRKAEKETQNKAAKKVAILLEDYSPSLVVIGEPPSKKSTENKRIGQVIKAIKEEAEGCHIPVQTLSRRIVAKVFEGEGCKTKHDRAAFLAKRFPDLAWKLPPKRKPWETEDYRMSIFDAAALGFAYFKQQALQHHPGPLHHSNT